MRETTELDGVVLSAQPIGEYDRRCVLLTRKRGRLTAFAYGARKATSPLLAVTNPFVFARFSLREGRNAYTFYSAEATAYFTELAAAQPEIFYGCYFLELAGYYAREGVEASESVDLIYVALKALLRKRMPPELIRRVYECRLLTINGEFDIPEESAAADKNLIYTIRYSAFAPLPRLFSFTLNDHTAREFATYVERNVNRSVDRKLKSLEVLRQMI